ncbi:hypothetical protein FRX31_006662, partial [Thalictrum thalictroides]
AKVKKNAADKVWVQTGARIRINVENEEKETDKEEQTRNEVIKSLDKGDDMQTNVKGAGEFGVEKLGSKEVWETRNKKDTARALTVANCRNKGVTIVTGREQEGTPMDENRQVTIEQIKGKGIKIEAHCQGEGKSGKKRDGFMKDARQAIGEHGTGRGTTSISNANKKINA